MISPQQATLDPAFAAAGELLGAVPDKIEPVAGGRNSRVYRVEIAGRLYALKRYPSLADDPRDRLETEVEALALMAACELSNVSRVIAVDRKRNFALLSWLDGAPVTAVGDSDIDQAAAFLAIIHGMRGAGFRRAASEACFCGTEIEAQIRRRLAALRAQSDGEPDLARFLSASFAPLLEQVLNRGQSEMAAAGLDFAAVLPQENRSLVPSDFGFHNALRRADGTLAFVDFEYFGWDDPVKLTADVLHHPGVPLGPSHSERFRTAALAIYGAADASFAARLLALYPLFGLRWALIVLNEFLPDRWRLRVAAGEMQSWAQAKTRQLARARELVARTRGMANG